MQRPRPVVFLGPSLPADEVLRRIPSARLCRPVRCGDVLALFRLIEPSTPIAIIDGAFEQVAAVWHKELLAAMSRGHPVLGASSMGALRAAELADFGMVGVGRIFEAYRDRSLLDDGDVAVLYATTGQGCAPLTEPLVNVRATVERAVAEGVVDAALGEGFVSAAAGVFYQQRGFEDVPIDGLGPAAVRLLRWVADGYVDRKRLDAIELFDRMADMDWDRLAPPRPPAYDTAFVRSLGAWVACRPAPFEADWLGDDERLARISRVLGGAYLLLRQVALADALLDACRAPETGASTGSASDAFSPPARGRPVLGRRMSARGDAPPYPPLRSSGPQGEPLHLRMSAQGDAPPYPQVQCGAALGLLLREMGLYPRFRARDGSPDAMRLFGLAAELAVRWQRLDAHLRARGVLFEPPAEQVVRLAGQLRADLYLLDADRLAAWMAANDLPDMRAFAAFVLESMRYRQSLSPQAIQAYGAGSVDLDRPFFVEALFRTGLGGWLCERLQEPAIFAEEVRQSWMALAQEPRERMARACDLDGYAEVEGILAAFSA